MKLKKGSKAPAFILWDENKENHSLADYAGKWVLIYFYPKDDTPGCTIEAEGIRDAHKEFAKRDVVVLGISKDTAPSHKRFIEKYKLPFTLLCDQEKEVAERYGALGKKTFMGKEYMGVLRNSYLVGPDGTIAKIYENVTPETHAEMILNDLSELQS